jgi:hypothetical protein
MKSGLGFVLITHSNPEQILFLCKRLTSGFNAAPIAIHHDFGKVELDKEAFPENVSFVEDWIPTRWGRFSIVDATLRALRTLYRDNDPDWFIVLSGSDYPIKTADAVLDDLGKSGFDAHLDYREVHYSKVRRPPDYGDYCYSHSAWVREPYNRYMAVGLGFFKLATRFKWKRDAFYLRWHVLVKLFTPFRGGIKCFAGDFWLTGNRKVATVLLKDSNLVRTMTAHFRKRPIPDEGYLHTVLLNTPGIKVSPDNKRYTDWSGCVGHPKWLKESDFPELLVSQDYFARKFEFNPELFQKLDRMIDSQEIPESQEALAYDELQ